MALGGSVVGWGIGGLVGVGSGGGVGSGVGVGSGARLAVGVDSGVGISVGITVGLVMGVGVTVVAVGVGSWPSVSLSLPSLATAMPTIRTMNAVTPSIGPFHHQDRAQKRCHPLRSSSSKASPCCAVAAF